MAAGPAFDGASMRAEDVSTVRPARSRSLSELESRGRARTERQQRSDGWADAESDWTATARPVSRTASKPVERGVQRVSAESPEPPGEAERPARLALDDLSEPPRPFGEDGASAKPKKKSPAKDPAKNAAARKLIVDPIRQAQAKLDEDVPPKADAEKEPEEKPVAENPPEKKADGGKAPGRVAIKSPAQLKKVTAILPFADYEPDPEIAAKDPCRNQCPRPGHCKPNDAHLCPEELWEGGPFIGRAFEPSCFTWAATNLWYNPLYFEDVALERYGHTYCPLIQPAVSVGRFGAQVITLPYHMALDPICKKEYALGYYRPGDCAPKLCYQPPLSVRGGIAQAGVVTGLFFLIP